MTEQDLRESGLGQRGGAEQRTPRQRSGGARDSARSRVTSQPLTIRRFLRRLMDADATGWRVWVVSYLVFLLDELPFFWADQQQGWPLPWEWLTSSVLTTIAHAGLVLVLLLARSTWLRARVAQRRPAITVWTFVVATIVSIVIEVIAGALVASDAVLVSIDGLFYRMAALLVIAAAVATLAEQQRALSELLHRRAQLEVVRVEGESSVNRLRGEILDLVRRRVAAVGADVHYLVEVLRRLSQELAFDQAELRLGQAVESTRPTLRAVWRAMAPRPLLAPGLMATTITILAVRSTTFAASESSVVGEVPMEGWAVTVDTASLGRAALMIVTVWAASYLAAALTARLLAEAAQRSSVPLAWWHHGLAVIGAALLAQGLSALVYLAPGFSRPPFELWMLGTYVIPFLACSVVIGLARAVDHHAALTRDALAAAVSRLEWDTARLNAIARSERRSIAFLLHGSVLSSVRAAIERGIDHAGAEQAVSNMVDGIIEALRNGESGRLRTLSDRLADIALLWESVSEVILDLDEAVLLAVAGDTPSTAAASDIVAEAVTNSVTHARASRIDVRIRLADVDLLEIVVDDVAESDASTSTALSQGIGTRIFDELTVLWHRFPHGGGSRFQAWVPIGIRAEFSDSVGVSGSSAKMKD